MIRPPSARATVAISRQTVAALRLNTASPLRAKREIRHASTSSTPTPHAHAHSHQVNINTGSSSSSRAGGSSSSGKSGSSGIGWKVGVGLVAAGCVAGAAFAWRDEGTRRTLTFYRKVFPIYLHYRYVQINPQGLSEEEKDAVYDRLHEQYAPTVEKLTLELKGMYLKNAQLLSTRDEFIPPQYLAFCKRVQDQVPTEFTRDEVHRVIELAYRKPMSAVFAEFDDTPLGAASIGQAHLAKLHDGRRVVVKVMYPGIEHRFRSDLKTMQFFCELAMPQHVAALAEIEKQFLTEFDYVGEAANMQQIHDNIMPVFGREVVVPRPIKELCTQNVLVMDHVAGVRLVDGIRNAYRKYAASVGKTLEELENEQKQAIKEGKVKKRSLEEEHWRTQLLQTLVRIKDYSVNSARFAFNWSVGLVTFTRLDYEWSAPLIDLGYIIDLLNRVHAHEMFVDGAFNGDPHPGNVLLCPDGRLGLIDYGQVKRVDLETRLNYAKIICSLAHDDKQGCLAVYDHIGFKTKFMNPDIRYMTAQFWNDTDAFIDTNKFNVHTFIEWAHDQDPVVEMAQEYVMFARVSVLLRGVANAFGIATRSAVLWEPIAAKLLRDHNVEWVGV